MGNRARSVRVPKPLSEALQQEIRRRGIRDWSAGVVALLDEAVRASRAPGVVFADSPTGRRAVVAGSGVEVWEVIASWRALGESWDRLRAGYPWLTEPQLRAALAYYKLYPEEVDERLALEDEWTAERMAAELPFARSPGLGRA